MKTSLAIALLIAVIGSIPGALWQRRAAELAGEGEKLRERALKLGIAVEEDASSEGPRTKRQREDSERRALAIRSDLSSLMAEMDRHDAAGGGADPELQGRSLEIMSRLLELDPARFRALVLEQIADEQVSEKTRRDLLTFAILSLTDEDPETAIALFSGSGRLLEDSPAGGHVVSNALAKWAEQDPAAALAWMRENAGKHPGLVDDDTRRSLLSGAAAKDPSLAFRLIGELGLEHPMGAVNAIVMAGARDAESRTAVLKALREHLQGIQDPVVREETGTTALEVLAQTAEKESFESLSGWMDSAGLTAEEKSRFASGLSWFNTKQETGKWVEWMAGHLQASELSEPVRDLVGEWTQQDYVAAGKWLGSVADGPAKAAAVESYAAAVAEYEPKVAEQWAMSLPAGPAREATLQAIRDNWPSSDPEGAQAFARQHGLDPPDEPEE